MVDRLRPADPEFIGKYRLLSRLGEGGMGAVYLAEAPDGRPVAVKVIRPEYAHDQQFRARFRSEVNRARQVPPFCTAEVLDADPDHETPYLVVEYVDGPSLNEVVAEGGPLGGGSLHGVAVGVASALAAIHGVGVIHRDLKPRNVLFALGIPKVIDFGIARPLEPTSFHTRAEEVIGTLAYMAPERLDPETDRLITPAVDVFAWGAVVTYAGTSRTPFGGDTPAVTAARILTQPPRVGDLPPYLAELVGAALEKEPQNRPTAPELLDRLLVSGAPSAPPLPPELRREAEAAQQSGRYRTGEHQRPRGRRRVAVIAAGALVVAAGVAAGIGLRDDGGAADDRTSQAAQPGPAATASESPAGPTFFDPLSTDAAFGVQTGDAGACAVKKGLVVTAKDGQTMMCGEYAHLVFPPSQNIGVRATLADARSCATIRFRATADEGEADYVTSGYQVSVCADEVRLTSTVAAVGDPIATARRPTSVGSPHSILVVTTDRGAKVSVDDTPVLEGELTESNLLSGRVLLGAEPSGDGRAKVTFTDLRLRSGTDPAVPPAPAFATGDAQLTAGVWLLYEAHQQAIVEQAEYVTGAEYCRRYAVASTSPKCAKTTVPVYSGVRVALPVAAGVKYFDYRNLPASCLDPETHAGKCGVSRAVFSVMGDEFDPWAALVTIRAGRVVAVAHLDYH
ncbi:serine/threonine protein kinase [Actinoplanes sp. HUAS TT8]|uniref:serine/threonine protein kinase n=1 Tax=Actinoplanes sp. HUAS TT8 TaxID=3447453 RepID=UPI003F523FD2